jgi:hypothetical protein
MIRRIVVVSAALALSHAAQAQRVVRGTVFDSLVTHAPLADAEVVVVGLGRSSLTDARGRFELDSMPAGRHQITFYHAILDSLSVGAGLLSIVVPDSGALSLALATPSSVTLYHRICTGRTAESTGLVLGRVRDVDTEATLGQASVTAAWTQWTVGKGGIQRTEQSVFAVTDSSGGYSLCGVPTDIPVAIRARSGEFQSGPAVVQYAAGSVVALRDFAISRMDSAARIRVAAASVGAGSLFDSLVVPRGSGRITGVVVTPDGRPLQGAQAAILGLPIATTTDSSGAFYLVGLPAGTQTVEVRAIGFAPSRRSTTLKSATSASMTIVLDQAITVLPEVSVLGQNERRDRSGFEFRRRQGIGYYLTREDIARRRVFDVPQLLYYAPHVRIVWDGSTNVVKFARGAMREGTVGTCDPEVFIDGSPAISMDDVRPADVRGIEVYANPAEVPALYRRGDTTCGVILIWTSPALKRRR